MVQALQFTSDFKLGHYMKIPPRPMFTCQVVATIIAGTVQLGVQAWMFTNIRTFLRLILSSSCLMNVVYFLQPTCVRHIKRMVSHARARRCSSPPALSGVSLGRSSNSLKDRHIMVRSPYTMRTRGIMLNKIMCSPDLLLPRWCYCTCHCICSFKEVPRLHLQIRQVSGARSFLTSLC